MMGLTPLELADTFAGGAYALQLMLAPKMFLDMQLVKGANQSAEIMCAYCGIMILARCYCTTLITEENKSKFHGLCALQWGMCLLPSLKYYSAFHPAMHMMNIALQVVFSGAFAMASMKKPKGKKGN
ncbi:hypothetical protein RI054_07g39390 [Pseudoscourfieldia marina]